MFYSRKIYFGACTGVCGIDGHEFYEFTSPISDVGLENLAWQIAKENAEMYGIYPVEEYSEEDMEDDPDSYSDNIEGWWEEYDPEKHDQYSHTGVPNFQVY